MVRFPAVSLPPFPMAFSPLGFFMPAGLGMRVQSAVFFSSYI